MYTSNMLTIFTVGINYDLRIDCKNSIRLFEGAKCHSSFKIMEMEVCLPNMM